MSKEQYRGPETALGRILRQYLESEELLLKRSDGSSGSNVLIMVEWSQRSRDEQLSGYMMLCAGLGEK